MPSSIEIKSIKHPDTFSLVSGDTQLVSKIESINQSIRLILTTAPGELWGEPEYGSHLYEYLYDYSDAVLTRLIQTEISRALNRWEPRILLQESDISVTYEGVNAYILINYQIKYTNYRSSYEYIVRIKEESVYD